jgi:hypothetical protein
MESAMKDSPLGTTPATAVKVVGTAEARESIEAHSASIALLSELARLNEPGRDQPNACHAGEQPRGNAVDRRHRKIPANSAAGRRMKLSGSHQFLAFDKGGLVQVKVCPAGKCKKSFGGLITCELSIFSLW